MTGTDRTDPQEIKSMRQANCLSSPESIRRQYKKQIVDCGVNRSPR